MSAKIPKYRTCPTCGKRRLERVCEDVVFPLREGKRRVRHILHDHCRYCDERIFDVEASLAIEAAIRAARRRRTRDPLRATA